MSSKNKQRKPNEEQSDSYDSDSSGGDDSEAYDGNEVSLAYYDLCVSQSIRSCAWENICATISWK